MPDDHIILWTAELNRGEPLSIFTNLVNASLPSRISSRTLRRLLIFWLEMNKHSVGSWVGAMHDFYTHKTKVLGF